MDRIDATHMHNLAPAMQAGMAGILFHTDNPTGFPYVEDLVRRLRPG